MDEKDGVEKTTEPSQMSIAVQYLELDFDPCQARMDFVEALTLAAILQMVLNSHSVEVSMGRSLIFTFQCF